MWCAGRSCHGHERGPKLIKARVPLPHARANVPWHGMECPQDMAASYAVQPVGAPVVVLWAPAKMLSARCQQTLQRRKETPRTNVPKWQRTPETPFAAFCDAKSSETTAPFSFYFNLPLRTTVVNANRLLVWKCLVTHLRRGRILEAKNLLDLLLRAAAACN